jgi:hypothetical protein
MRYFFFFVIFILLLLVVFMPTKSNYSIISEKHLQKHQEIKGASLFDEINERNSKLKSFQADVDLKGDAVISFRLSGRMSYTTPHFFRMTLNSFFSKEVDIGSNETYFWYWSKHDDPPVINSFKHGETNRLKSPFNPKFILGSLGTMPLEYENCYIDEFNSMYRIIKQENDKNTCIMVNPKTKLIVSRSIYDNNKNLIAVSEIKSCQTVEGFILPKQIIMVWYQENIHLNLIINFSSVNKEINKGLWIMPK